MKRHSIEYLRNIGIMAHIDAGKTTTTERMLFYSGKIHRIGEVDEGTAVMDWMDQEKERGITIVSAVTTLYWNDYQINIIDTPGHVDFTAEVERSLRVLDGAVAIFSAVEGVEPQSETVWHQANKYSVPRIVYVNKMDRIGADFYRTVEGIADRLGITPLPLTLPVGKEHSFIGLIDVVKGKMIVWDESTEGQKFEYKDIPKEMETDYHVYKDNLFEVLSDVDDTIAEKYLEGNVDDIDEKTIKNAIRKGVVLYKFVPVLCGSSLKNIGVQPLMDAVTDYLPAPTDLPPVIGEDAKTHKHVKRNRTEDEPFTALVFKVVTNPQTGRIYYIRIYSGKLSLKDTILDVNTGKKERISKIFMMHSNTKVEISEATAGDIVAVVGPRFAKTGHTFTDRKHPLFLEPPHFTEPVISLAIEPRTKGDEKRLKEVLDNLMYEDPTFRYYVNDETGQMIIAGMGELHLEVMVEKIRREYKIDLRKGNPEVSYRETITVPVSMEEKFEKQTGGKGQYAHIIFDMEPIKEGVEFVNKIKGDILPEEYIHAVEEGIKESSNSGVIAGYPVINFKFTLKGGSFHSVDSSDIAFKAVANIGFHKAQQEGSPALLEPFMRVEIHIPSEYVGNVINDITQRRGRVVDNRSLNEAVWLIDAVCPLREMFGYATDLRNITQGRGTYTMMFSHYEIVEGKHKDEIYKSIGVSF